MNNLDNIPDKVLMVLMSRHSGIPVSFSIWEEAITEHPEYFPEEVERRRRWARVPEDVKTMYGAAIEALVEKYLDLAPAHPSGGISKWIMYVGNEGKTQEQLDQIADYDAKMKELREKYWEEEARIHLEYLNKYGIEHKKGFAI